MRPLAIELADKIVEPGLLLQGVHLGRPAGFLFQGQVHALVASVLGRFARFDAFNIDAETEPPDRELR